MQMTTELLGKIDRLIALAEPRNLASASGYSHALGDGAGIDAIQDVLYGAPDPVLQCIERMADDEIVAVMALALFGNDKGGFGDGSTFAQALEYARSDLERDGRDRIISYIGSKPLSRYLPAGLQRARLV